MDVEWHSDGYPETVVSDSNSRLRCTNGDTDIHAHTNCDAYANCDSHAIANPRDNAYVLHDGAARVLLHS